jgi:histidinol-phosphatase (PHP family)
VDYFPETIEQVRTQLAPYPFDYLIGSIHFIDAFPVDFSVQPWQEVTQDMRNELWRNYWKLLRAAALSGVFDVIGHFDLPKKFKFYPSLDLTADALSVLDAMAEADIAIEINTSGWDRPVNEAYPALNYLQEARRRGIPLVINADAHAPGEVTRHFDRAGELAETAGYSEVARFERRRRTYHRL